MLPRSLALLVLWVLAISAPGFAQRESLIQDEIGSALEGSLWKAGPFRLSPSIRLDGGYDSNAFSSAQFPEGDYLVRFAPGLRAAAPIRNRALLEVLEEVNFVYYREMEDLRQVFPVTRVAGAFGGSRFVVRVDDTFREEKTRPTSEFDIPVDQSSNAFGASLRMALGWRHELALSYRRSRFRILDGGVEVGGVPVESRLDRDEEDYRLRLARRLTGKTSAVVEGFYEILDFVEDTDLRDADSYGAVAGFTFTPRTNVQGQALLGYKRIIPDAASQADYRGLIGSVDVGLRLGARLQVQGVYSRDAVPSVLASNWFFIENRFGGSVEIFIMPRFSVRPGAVFGRNTYPRPETFLDEEGQAHEVQVKDLFETYSLSLDYRLTETWTVSVTGIYLQRDSNFRDFTKDRFTLGFGVTAGIGSS